MGKSVKLDDVFYHGSLASFDPEAFLPFSHFGTLKAALQRVGELLSKASSPTDMAYLYPVFCQVRNPFRIADGKNWKHSPCALADMLFYGRHKLITSSERSEVLSAHSDPDTAFRILAGIVEAKGYNGFVYTNKHEDTGSQSVICLHAHQIQPESEPTSILLPDIIAWIHDLNRQEAMKPKPQAIAQGNRVSSAFEMKV